MPLVLPASIQRIIDLIIVATSTPDFLYPSTACLVQAAIGASQMLLLLIWRLPARALFMH